MNSDKPSLVLLSGLLCDSCVWDDVRAELSDTADVQVFSFAGYNDFDAMATHVLNNTPERFALAGHSMGGRVALQLANLAPERLTHLALLNTGVHPRSDSEVAGRQRLLELADTEGMQAVAKQWLPPMVGEAAQKNAELMAMLDEMIMRHSPADFHGQIKALLNRPDATPFLSSVRVPTLLLSGSEDAWSPIAQHAAMQEHLVDSELVELDKIGHMSTVETPVKIAEHLRALMKR